MGKAAKATKKFQNKHLKHTIEHRRDVQKENKKMASRRGKGTGPEPKVKKATKPIFDDMSVDEFFEGGFEVPKAKKGTAQDAEGSENESESDSDNDSEDDLNDSENELENSDNEHSDESSEEEDEDMMKQDMANLAEKDPEFFDYLKNNEKELLDFEGVNPLDAMSDGSDAEASDAEDVPSKPAAAPQKRKIVITKNLVASWDTQLQGEPKARTIQNVIAAFKTVVYANSDDKRKSRYALEDPDVFGDLMFVGLKRVPQAVQKLVPYKVNQKGTRLVDAKHEQYKSVGRLARSQAGSYITLLQDITNTETAAVVLASVQELLPFYISQRKVLKQIVSAVADVWASSTDVETQVATYAFLNNAAREYVGPMLELVLRTVYSAFVKNCRKTNVHTMDSLNFAKNSAAGLFGIDERVAYTVGFEYVRQLAVHLRNSISATSAVSAKSGKDAYKAIYNWQFCHSLDFWSRVLAQSCNPEHELQTHASHESPLRPLIYPLVQVTLGAVRLIPTAQFFPLRFYLVRSLIRLSQGSGVYIPIFPIIFEILTSTAFSRPPKNVALPAVDFDHVIKVNQQYLGTKAYQDGLCEQFLELISEFLVLYCKSIAFPELVTPVILSLRRFMKKSRNSKFNKQMQQLVEKLNSNATYITAKRSNVEYGPSNKAEVQAFLKEEKWEATPLGQYVVVHRKSREERVRILKEAVAAEDQARQKKKNADAEMEDAVGAQLLDASDEE